MTENESNQVPCISLLALLEKHHDAFREYASELLASPFDLERVAIVARRLDELCNAMTADINANSIIETSATKEGGR